MFLPRSEIAAVLIAGLRPQTKFSQFRMGDYWIERLRVNPDSAVTQQSFGRTLVSYLSANWGNGCVHVL